MTIFKDKRTSKIFLNYMLNGERKRKSTGLLWSDENVKIVKTQIIPKLEKALKYGVPKDKTFGYYSNIFLGNQDKKQSYLQKEGYWHKAINVFKAINIDEISALDVQQYINSLNILAKSKKEYLFALRETFRLAIMDGVIRYNPAFNIDCGKDRKVEIQYFQLEELSRLIETAYNDKNTDIFNYILIVSNTGIRPEEAIALNWSDIKYGFITINKAKTKGKFVPTKTYNGVRKVPFKLFDKLKFNKNIAIFPNQKDISHFRHQWKRVLKNADIKYRAIKNLRHTFATHSLKNGVPLNILSRVLGHSSPKVTLQHYASVLTDEYIEDDRLLSVSINVSTSVNDTQKAL